jgi:hypothetical protein
MEYRQGECKMGSGCVPISSLTAEGYSRYISCHLYSVHPHIRPQARESCGYHGQQERVLATQGDRQRSPSCVPIPGHSRAHGVLFAPPCPAYQRSQRLPVALNPGSKRLHTILAWLISFFRRFQSLAACLRRGADGCLLDSGPSPSARRAVQCRDRTRVSGQGSATPGDSWYAYRTGGCGS